MDEYILAIAPEAGTEQARKFRSGFYYLAKELNIPYLPIELDFKNRRFHIQKEQFVSLSFEEESLKIISLFEGVGGALREFKMLEEEESIWQWLEEGAVIYVCGDARGMAPDVHKALIQIVENNSSYNGSEFMEQLDKQKRYMRDIY